MILEVSERAERLKRLPEVASFALYARNLENLRRAVASLAGHAHMVAQHVQVEVELGWLFVTGGFIEFGHVLARRRRGLALLPLGELVLEFDGTVTGRPEDIGHGQKVLVAFGDA